MQVKRKADFFKALGDETRLKIVRFLLKEDTCRCICHIAKYVKKDQSTVFRHIKELEASGIIVTSKDNKFLMCDIKDKKRMKEILE